MRGVRMKLIIDIDEEEYEECKQYGYETNYFERAIANGIPLPKGHGRLIDADDFFDEFCEIAIEPYINAPTIIEADKENEE